MINTTSELCTQLIQGISYISVAEEDGFAHVPVVRRGGDYGSVGVRYAVQDITALVGIDYASPDTSVNFTDGTTLNTINIYLFDDSEMEFAEQLQVTLLETTGMMLYK